MFNYTQYTKQKPVREERVFVWCGRQETRVAFFCAVFYSAKPIFT